MAAKVTILAACALLLPALGVRSQPVVRNLYAETGFMGATTFLTYVDKAKMTKMLKDPTVNLTVLAPSNVAFSNLPAALRDQLDNDAAFLKKVMDFHIIKGPEYLLTNNSVIQTLAEEPVRVDIYQNPDMTTVSGSPVLLYNNSATNGIVHIVEKVLISVPDGPALTMVSSDPNYSMFYLALTKAGVTSLLNADGLTLFAPPNAAFQKLPAGLFAELLDDVPLLTKVIQTHLVSDVIYSAYVIEKNGTVVNAQSGEKLSITVTGLNGAILEVNRAMVTSRDNNVDNGVVHVVSDVFLPAKNDVDETPSFRVVY